MRRGLPATLLTLLAVALAVAACGGGAGSGTSDSNPNPHEITLGGGEQTVRAGSTPTRVETTRAPATVSGPRRPPIVKDFIPFGAQRKQEMAAYAERHYGIDSYRLVHPRVIVEHYTETPDFQSTYNTFAPDVPDSELHELPNTCAHFVIDRDGTIHQLVPLDIMCRHTVGLNYTAIGIEHVGMSDQDVMGDQAQLDASLRLTAWLRCRYGIAVRNVIGHNESLTSPYHHENVPALRTQTHQDMQPAAMDVYRHKLAERPCAS
jgi:N-acetylmuramoyl-L-alanine amidase